MSKNPSRKATLCMEIDNHKLGIEVADGKVRMFEEAKGDHSLEMGFRGLAKMVSGFSLPSELIRSGEVKAAPHLVEILDELFPVSYPHIYYSELNR